MAKKGPRVKTDRVKVEINRFRQKGCTDQEIRNELLSMLPKLIKDKKVRDEDDIPSVYNIAKLRRALEKKEEEVNALGLEKPWNFGLMTKPKYSINPLAVPYILRIQDYVSNNEDTVLTIRNVLWISRLFAMIGTDAYEATNEEIEEFWTYIILNYSEFERESQTLDGEFDTFPFDMGYYYKTDRETAQYMEKYITARTLSNLKDDE